MGKEKDDFEAKFEFDGKDASAVYDKNGKRKAFEIAIYKSEFPTPIEEYLKKKYPKSKVLETAKITDDKNVVTFEAEIKIDGKPTDVIFDAKGTFIKTSQD